MSVNGSDAPEDVRAVGDELLGRGALPSDDDDMSALADMSSGREPIGRL